MNIYKRIDNAFHEMTMNTGLYPKYLYLGSEEYIELTIWIKDNIDVVPIPGTCKHPVRFIGMTVFKVCVDNHIHCSL